MKTGDGLVFELSNSTSASIAKIDRIISKL